MSPRRKTKEKPKTEPRIKPKRKPRPELERRERFEMVIVTIPDASVSTSEEETIPDASVPASEEVTPPPPERPSGTASQRNTMISVKQVAMPPPTQKNASLLEGEE